MVTSSSSSRNTSRRCSWGRSSSPSPIISAHCNTRSASSTCPAWADSLARQSSSFLRALSNLSVMNFRWWSNCASVIFPDTYSRMARSSSS